MRFLPTRATWTVLPVVSVKVSPVSWGLFVSGRKQGFDPVALPIYLILIKGKRVHLLALCYSGVLKLHFLMCVVQREVNPLHKLARAYLLYQPINDFTQMAKDRDFSDLCALRLVPIAVAPRPHLQWQHAPLEALMENKR